MYSVENPVEHLVEIQLNWVPDSEPPPPSRFPRVEDSKIIGALQECRATNMCIVENTGLEEDSSGEELADSSEELISSSEGALEDEDESVVGWGPCDSWSDLQIEELHCAGITSSFAFLLLRLSLIVMGLLGWVDEMWTEVRSSELDDVLEVDDVFHSVLLHDLALPEEVQFIFLHRKRSWN